jgi:hypothetical protein
MTETEWLTGTDPQKMLRFIFRQASHRKLRLFACAWCRHMPYPLPDPRSRTAVAMGECYADGLICEEERLAARDAAQLVVENAVAEQQFELAAGAADARRCIETAKGRIVRLEHTSFGWLPLQGQLLREIFGPLPFRPVVISPSIRAWNGSTVVRLAQGIYDERAFDRLPILADALEEGGCTNDEILAHCREPGLHMLGCWVLDLILNKK